MSIKSKEALQYEKDFLKQITGEAKQKWGSLERSLRLDAVVYYRSRRSDLSVELLKDLLEKAGVVKNDRYICEEHLWAFVDKDNPRVEMRLYYIPVNRQIPFELSKQ